MVNPKAVIEVVGGARAMGHSVAGPLDIARAVRRGLPTETVTALVESGRLTMSEVDRTVIPRKTFAHRRKIGSLTPEQSDRLLRLARIIALAEETFGDKENAAFWLRRPTTALDGEAPLDLLDTDEGSRQVEILLGRIAHGIAA